MKLMIDMFAGLGGASAAMINDEDWIVRRFDNNPALRQVQDIHISNDMFYIVEGCPHDIELLWASPPCQDFSLGFHSPLSKHYRGEEGYEDYEPNMKLLMATINTIKKTNPKYWVIENVKGSIKFFEPFLGKPTQIIGSQVLWGNFPFINMPEGFRDFKKDNDKGPNNPLRSNYRAVIPYEISLRLKIAVEEQRCLLEWV
tara:strand:- start:3853 stop:4452 length:600 start_codon:yes stop_codon:yes gene_type:complete